MEHRPTDASNEGRDLDVDLLINRLIDGEATDDDRAGFEARATVEPALWQRLAGYQEDRMALGEQFELETTGIDAIDLPAPRVGHGGLRLAAWSGWAAVLALAAVWGLSQMVGGMSSSITTVPAGGLDRSALELTAEEHLRSYKNAPFVLGELDPILLQAEELTDGRVALRFLRRIEEIAILEAERDVPTGDDGRLLVSPEALRTGGEVVLPDDGG